MDGDIATLGGIRVVVNPYLPPNTIAVSPEMFEQIKKAFDAGGEPLATLQNTNVK